MKNFYLTLVLVLLLQPLAAQNLSKEDKLNEIKLKQSELNLEKSRRIMENLEKEYKENQELYSNQIITVTTLNEIKNEYENAVYEFQKAKYELEKTRLDFLQNSLNIAVREAVKFSRNDGEIDVIISLKNISRANYHVRQESEDNWQSLLDITDLVVSVKDDRGSIICEPYEVLIDRLPYNTTRKIRFKLLRKEVVSVMVMLKHLNVTENKNVYLKKKSLLDIPSLDAVTYSQEGKLGETIQYGLSLERLSEEADNFAIRVLGLPREIRANIKDLGTGTLSDQVKIGGNNTRKNYAVELVIPGRLDDNMLNKSLSFYVLVTDMKHVKQVFELQKKTGNKTVNESQVKAIKGNYVELVVTPIGSADLKINLPKKYEEISELTELSVKIDVENTGTTVLQNVRIEADVPSGWESHLDPLVIKKLEAGEKEYVTVTLTPAEDSTVGEYDIVFSAEGEERGVKLQSDDASYTVKVQENTSLLLNAVIIFVIFGVIIGISIFTIRFARS